MKITLIGHDTLLFETGGCKIVTDPYFGTWGNLAYSRTTRPSCTRQDLSRVDAVLVSHDHWDHTDSAYFRLIGDTPVVVPRLTRWMYRLMGCRNTIPLDTWDDLELGPVTITAVPAIHGTVSQGYVIQAEGKNVYFAGDTFHRPFMADIAHRFQLDAALIPVTTFRLPMTMNEKQAVHAVQDLNPKVVLPIHLALRPRSIFNRTGDTAEHFAERLKEKGSSTPVVILKPGESYTL